MTAFKASITVPSLAIFSCAITLGSIVVTEEPGKAVVVDPEALGFLVLLDSGALGSLVLLESGALGSLVVEEELTVVFNTT